ncbi:MAG: TetR family transcriptional regulator, partial [Pygmaiobacter sp.]
MADSAHTKRVLGDSLKELMQKKPLAKISVGDITAHCGINRQTFYYHFKDKYDLVNWIYTSETIPY